MKTAKKKAEPPVNTDRGDPSEWKDLIPSPATPPAVPQPEPEFKLLPLESIHASPINPRKTFDADALAQLTESVRTKGVLEPILVRGRAEPCEDFIVRKRKTPLIETLAPDPVKDHATWEVFFTKSQPGDNGIASSWHEKAEAEAEAARMNEAEAKLNARKSPTSYELVAGERRYRAAKAAGLATIPAIIRVLDDHAALEVAVIENDQREDVPPMEQADGYARLCAMGDDAETIAAKIGRPIKYVTARLQLTKLIEPLQEDLREGKLPFGHAHLLARLTPADQETFAGKPKFGSGDLYDWVGEPHSLAHLRQSIKRFTADLSAAPWKKDDADLVPAAGACKTCPKRSGSNPTLFDELLNGDAKPGRDFCTDRACYSRKQTAFIELQLKKASADANNAEVLKLSANHYSANTDDKSVLTASQYEIVSKKDARSAKPGTLKTAVMVEANDGGDLGKIVHVRLKKQSKSSGSGDDSYKRQQAEQRKKAEAGKATARKACGQVAERMLAETTGGIIPSAAIMKPLLLALVDAVWADASRLVAKRRELGKGDPRDLIAKHIETLDTPADYLILAGELLAAKRAAFWGNGHWTGRMEPDESAFWKAFGVDRSKLLKEVEKESGKTKTAKDPATEEEWDKSSCPSDLVVKLSEIDNFPDAAFDVCLTNGVSSLPTLLEAVDAVSEGIDLPLRNRLCVYFVKLGLKKAIADNAAKAVAEHVEAKPVKAPKKAKVKA